MKNNLIFICIFFLVNSAKSQIGFHKFSMYGNGGVSIYDNFDYHPTNTAFGELGARYHLGKGLSVGLNVNSVFFRKAINLNEYVASFYTQYNALGISTLYENEIFTKWYLGIGGSLNFGLFTGKIYDNFGGKLGLTSGVLDVYLDRRVYNYVGNINLRTFLTNHLDFQFGVSYNHFQSYYLDMYNINDKLDTYILGYAGLVFEFGEADRVGVGINSKRLKCPNVNY